MTTIEKKSSQSFGLPIWVYVLIPLVAIVLMLLIFAYSNPLSTLYS